jgi:hypothetical protein
VEIGFFRKYFLRFVDGELVGLSILLNLLGLLLPIPTRVENAISSSIFITGDDCKQSWLVSFCKTRKRAVPD